MSVKIHFAFGVKHRIQQAAQTAAKNYRSAKKILVYSSEQKRLDVFSRMLWDLSPESFVPQESIHSAEHLSQLITEEWAEGKQAQPVLLLQQSELLTHPEFSAQGADIWLLNLDLACPPNYQHFACVLEIVSEHETDKQYARERWKQYRSDGAELLSHQIGGK
ncbi:MAG: DNA polymerase III subunit chi [Alcaligenaceae bacterium]|nr:DNA polymerase III subunit chi [Alcaligenaceae bacterium]